MAAALASAGSGRSRTILVSDWGEGQSRSVRAGLAAAQAQAGGKLSAAVFLLADQPAVTPELLSALVRATGRRWRRSSRPAMAGSAATRCSSTGARSRSSRAWQAMQARCDHSASRGRNRVGGVAHGRNLPGHRHARRLCCGSSRVISGSFASVYDALYGGDGPFLRVQTRLPLVDLRTRRPACFSMPGAARGSTLPRSRTWATRWPASTSTR